MEKDEKTGLEAPCAEPDIQQILTHLRAAQQIAVRSVESGHHPFGSILVAPDNQTILLEQTNIDALNHAESTLARSACSAYSPDYLQQCTLYTTVEPCCMCAGAIYWANIGRVAYGLAEEKLLEITGNNEKNPTLNIPCRYVFSRGQKTIKVWGPFPEIERDILSLHEAYWV